MKALKVDGVDGLSQTVSIDHDVEVRRYWPNLPDGALVADYSGVRPKLSAPGDAAPKLICAMCIGDTWVIHGSQQGHNRTNYYRTIGCRLKVAHIVREVAVAKRNNFLFRAAQK